MSVVFKKVRWKNLLSTGNNSTEIDIENSDLTLIIGPNGSGKCVRKNTKIDIGFNDVIAEKKFNEFMKKRPK